MTTSLLAEFDAGRAAFHADTVPACPYMATSDCADAWHAGFEYERRRPSVYGVDRVWHGRGYRINVRDGIGHPRPSKAPVATYRIDWPGNATPIVVREA